MSSGMGYQGIDTVAGAMQVLKSVFSLGCFKIQQVGEDCVAKVLIQQATAGVCCN